MSEPAGGLGATIGPDGGIHVEVWAPNAESVAIELDADGSRQHLTPAEHGYHRGVVAAGAGDRYWIVLDTREPLPDPASRHQPEGVHGPSAVVDPSSWEWTDGPWSGLTMDDLVVYEAHVGTLTAEGTFDAAIGELDRLASLGITAVELMPVAQFPGGRNWGYDGVFPWAVQNTYGGPEGLARFVDAAHARGIGVLLDVVYNHIGPEGNVLAHYGPYFTDRYTTPWGPALNLDGSGSDEVRRLFVDSARMYVRDLHIDGFRLDAVHAIVDPTPTPLVEELTAAVHAEAAELGRDLVVIAESSADDPRLIRPVSQGGYGLDGCWNDDVHHALRVALTGDRDGYYVDYQGAADLVTAIDHGFVYTGQRSTFRGRRHGRDAADVPSRAFVVFSTNHDHVGNRPRGDRLDDSIDPDQRRLAPAFVLLTPFTPLLFMGEEYGERRPFPYFVSHEDPELVEAVRRGRREEFAGHGWDGEVTDPAAVSTFTSAIVDPAGGDPGIAALYARLLELRRSVDLVTDPDADTVAREADGTVTLERRADGDAVFVAFRFAPSSADVGLPPGEWQRVLDTADVQWGGPGSTDDDVLAPWSAGLWVPAP